MSTNSTAQQAKSSSTCLQSRSATPFKGETKQSTESSLGRVPDKLKFSQIIVSIYKFSALVKLWGS